MNGYFGIEKENSTIIGKEKKKKENRTTLLRFKVVELRINEI